MALHRNRSAWECDVVRRAVYFTSIKFLGRAQYHRVEFPTLPEAIAHAKTDPRRMVYAVSNLDESAMLPQAEWEMYLKIWNERKQQ